MRPLAIFSVFALLLVGCTSSRAQVPKVYYYEYSCDTWREPARIVANQLTGQMDTTLALVSGRIVNNTGNSMLKAIPVLIIAKGTDAANLLAVYSDSTGQYRLYVPSGHYTIEFSSLDYAIFKVTNLDLHLGQKRQLDVFLQESARSLPTCVYKSKRELSNRQYKALTDKLDKIQARHARLYPSRPEADGSVMLTIGQ